MSQGCPADKRIKAFFAFPSRPPALPDTLKEAVSRLNGSGYVSIQPWTDLKNAGRSVISTICAAIDSCPLFLADITLHNPNVLFELGYAIAKRKRIWLLHDESRDVARRRLHDVGLFDAIGYAKYTNADDIVRMFYQDEPYESLDKAVYHDLVPEAEHTADRSNLLYLQLARTSEASRRLATEIRKSALATVKDDPQEDATPEIGWYLRHAARTDAILAHLDADDVPEAASRNARYAFVAGFGHALHKQVLMLAEAPYQCPLDYSALLRVHETPTQAVQCVATWLTGVKDVVVQRARERRETAVLWSERQRLTQVFLGEYVAENEAERLPEYFVETGAYHEARNARLCLFVGRKGTGKTANLLTLAQELHSDKRNLTCTIQPTAYNTESVLSSLQAIRGMTEMGGVYDALWKYMIYGDLCLALYERISTNPAPSSEQIEFQDFCRKAGLIGESDFGLRLELRLTHIVEKVAALWDGESKVRLAEELHDDPIPQMRAFLGRLLQDRKRVVVLLDNLDKSWTTREDIEELCRLLLGLLSAMRSIESDFQRAEHWREALPLSLVVFIRSDIYTRLLRVAREPDKLYTARILWDDPELLIRVITDRACHAVPDMSEEAVWKDLFAPTVHGQSTSEFIARSVFPRPRDMIVLAKKSLSLAVTRGHTRIEEQDILDACKDYSEYAYNSICVEDANGVGKLEPAMYALLGLPPILSAAELRAAFARETIADDLCQPYIDALCRLSVLGQETAPGQFTFTYDESTLDRDTRLSASFATGANRRYRIHQALWPALSIQAV